MITDKLGHKTKWIIRRYADEAAFLAGRSTPVVDAHGQTLPAVSHIDGNLLLNEGIGEMWDLVCGLGTPTAFSNANARIGVGDGGPTALTGTVTMTNGSTAVTGSGTAFDTEVAVGDFIKIAGGQLAQVLTVGSATSITLAAAYAGATGTASAVKVLRAIATQTDLQAATNKTYKAQESGYPQRSSQTVTFRSVFGSADANYDWQEFVVDNGASAAKTLNRKVDAQGTKVAGQVWTFDVEILFS